MPEDTVANFGKNVPMKRPGQPAELATAYVMLADPLSSYVSGATIAVTGWFQPFASAPGTWSFCPWRAEYEVASKHGVDIGRAGPSRMIPRQIVGICFRTTSCRGH